MSAVSHQPGSAEPDLDAYRYRQLSRSEFVAVVSGLQPLKMPLPVSFFVNLQQLLAQSAAGIYQAGNEDVFYCRFQCSVWYNCRYAREVWKAACSWGRGVDDASHTATTPLGTHIAHTCLHVQF